MTAGVSPARDRQRRQRTALLAGFAVFSIAAAALAADMPTVTTKANDGETTYQLTLANCTADLVRSPEDTPFVYRNACRQDLETRVAVFAHLVAAALSTAADREAGATVFVPGLEKAFPDFARRLAQAAGRSTEWYGERAKRDPRFGNRLALKIATTPPVYRELQEALRRQDLNVRLAAIDNLRIAPAPETPFADWLADRGVSARDQLPYDADVSFRITQ